MRFNTTHLLSHVKISIQLNELWDLILTTYFNENNPIHLICVHLFLSLSINLFRILIHHHYLHSTSVTISGHRQPPPPAINSGNQQHSITAKLNKIAIFKLYPDFYMTTIRVQSISHLNHQTQTELTIFKLSSQNQIVIPSKPL